jgi:dephospho-CoA kinase
VERESMNEEQDLRPRLLLGLTGGIGAGKSTVARLLAEAGAAVVDADRLARAVVAPGSGVLAAIAREFGGDLLDEGGRLDRQRMAEVVFADPDKRRRLEAITHPAIARASRDRFAELAAEGHALVVYEAALLVETGRHREMDRLLVVVADDEVRLGRLVARDGLSRAEAERRLAAQLSQRDKAQLADYLIDNSKGLKQTRAQLERVWRALQQEIEDRGAVQRGD